MNCDTITFGQDLSNQWVESSDMDIWKWQNDDKNDKNDNPRVALYHSQTKKGYEFYF